jgi:(p)ppGpp synthase/HD superfamily hydrolase
MFFTEVSMESKCDPRIEKAILLVLEAFEGKVRIGPTPTPASTHSLSVGISLLKSGCAIDTILAGFCHDMDEDTHIKIPQIVEILGERVGEIVTVCTIDTELEKSHWNLAELKLYEQVIDHARQGNLEPLMVKCADSMDNNRTSKDVPIDWQVPMLRYGIRWLEAGKVYIPDFVLLEEFELVINRERKRLSI